jgi:hypothetical protein
MSRIALMLVAEICTLASLSAVAQQSRAQRVGGSTASNGIAPLRVQDDFFNPGRKKVLSYRDVNVILTLFNEEKNLSVGVENLGEQTRGKVDLPAEIVQVNEIRAGQKGKAVVIGMVNGSAFEVVILNTRPIAIADSFLAYSPSVSPDGHFIAFVKFYPLHFVDGVDDHYLLYDVGRSAGENRSAKLNISDRTDVGISLQPNIANQPGDNTGVPQSQQHHMAAQAFFWRSDSERYAFADDRDGGLDLVLVSPSSQAVPVVDKLGIPRSEICGALRTQTCQVTLSHAELTGTGVLALFRGVGVDSSLEQLVQYPYEKFSSAR